MTVLRPSDIKDLRLLIADHQASGTPLAIQGGGTREVAGAGQGLSLAGLSGVVDYQPDEMVLIAKAATPLSQITPLLAQSGQSLAFEPMDLRPVLGTAGEPTLGGMLATNASGPRRLLVGACRDHLLGLSFIDGRGREIKSGGRVMKNVTGLDMARFMAGAHGTLGVVTEIAIKTLPKAPLSITLVMRGLSLTAAQAVFAEALATPYELSGAGFKAGEVFLRIEGLPAQVAWRREKLSVLLKAHAPEVLEGEASDALWQGLRDAAHFADHNQPLWRILTAGRRGGEIAHALQSLGGAVSLDWGGGLIWYQGQGEAAAIRALAPHATLIRPAGLHASRFPPEASGVARLSEGLRRSFDPADIFNRGLFSPEQREG